MVQSWSAYDSNHGSARLAWLQGYNTPENDPPVIDVHKLLSDNAKLTEHCVNNPEDDIMMAFDAVFGK
jgi:hypothetical protein